MSEKKTHWKPFFGAAGPSCRVWKYVSPPVLTLDKSKVTCKACIKDIKMAEEWAKAGRMSAALNASHKAAKKKAG